VAGDRDHAVGHVPELPEGLLGGELDARATVGIAGLVEDQHALGLGPQPRMRPPEREPALMERVAVPRRIM
jgi:hypothetical protein